MSSEGFEVVTDQGTWRAPTVVLATGACNVPLVPACAAGIPSGVEVRTPMDYRGADDLPDGGVLVVGASATGVQLADEIHRSGRPVTIAVGEHVRMPRLYRGRDIFWWMEAAGLLDERYDEVDDIVRARHVPSPQLIGSPSRATLDLNRLVDAGVRVVGRLGGVTGTIAQLAGSLANVCALADLKMNRLLARFDEWAAATGADDDVEPPERPEPTRVEAQPPLALSLGGEIRTVLFATGYRADHTWLDVPVLDRRGRIRHDGGVVVDAPGMYVVGLPFLRRRRSSFIHGAVADSADLGAHLHGFLDANQAVTATVL